MGEMAEAPAPVDQSPPSDLSSGAGDSQAVAADCYNARSMMGNEGQESPQAESAVPAENPYGQEDQTDGSYEAGDAENSLEDGQTAAPDVQAPDSDRMADQEPGAHQEQASSPMDDGQQSLDSEGNGTSPMEITGESPVEAEVDQSPPPEAGQSEQTEQQEAPNDDQVPDQQPQKQPNQGDDNQGQGEAPKPHKLKYDEQAKQKEKDLARRQMMNPHYFLPTDFSKHFDIPTSQGPKQPQESPMARANRRLDEMKVWRKKLDEQSPMVYNRKVSKSGS